MGLCFLKEMFKQHFDYAFVMLLIVSIRLSYVLSLYSLLEYKIVEITYYNYNDNNNSLHCAKCFAHITPPNPLNNPTKVGIIISSPQIKKEEEKLKYRETKKVTQDNGVRKVSELRLKSIFKVRLRK